MRMFQIAVLFHLFVVFACKKDNNVPQAPANADPYYHWPETFNDANKTGYAEGTVQLKTGEWLLADALLGGAAADRKTDGKALRITNTGRAEMLFDLEAGIKEIRLWHGIYGSDAAATWLIEHSTDAGASWLASAAQITTDSPELTELVLSITFEGKVRFRFRKLSGGRLNIDDFLVSQKVLGMATRDDNLAMGNPSNALPLPGSPENYLMVKDQYALAYNNATGIANWVSWHLSTAWRGKFDRCDCFTGDNDLPSGFLRVVTSNYTNSGFDRGHSCPSADRTGSAEDNRATFLMTNIFPQAPRNNRVVWANFEDYCRRICNGGRELYIVMGTYGTGGTGDNGTANAIFDGRIRVPERIWKVALVLPIGNNDVQRVDGNTRVIAVDMPNTNASADKNWWEYRTTVDAIEAATGYDLFSNVAANIQAVIESKIDTVVIR